MRAKLIYWRMAIWRGGWRAVRAFLVTVFVGSNAVGWTSLSRFEKAVIIVGGIVAAGNELDAFLDQTMTRISEGKPLLGGHGGHEATRPITTHREEGT